MCKLANCLSGILVLLCISSAMQAQEGLLLHSHTPSGLNGSTFRYLVSNVDANERSFANAVDSQGRIIIAGYSTETDILVARYLSDGRFDPTFGEAGRVKVVWPATEAHIFDTVLTS